MTKKSTNKPVADKAAGIDACVARFCSGLDETTRAVLMINLRSIPQFIQRVAEDTVLEKQRKRQIDKVRTNAARLVSDLDELDEEARLYVAYCMAGGDPGAEHGYDRSVDELRALEPLISLKNFLRAMSTAKASQLPFRWKERPELLLAADMVKAFNVAGVDVAGLDDGIAAECFYALAEAAGLDPRENARYWITKAKASDYI